MYHTVQYEQCRSRCSGQTHPLDRRVSMQRSTSATAGSSFAHHGFSQALASCMASCLQCAPKAGESKEHEHRQEDHHETQPPQLSSRRAYEDAYHRATPLQGASRARQRPIHSSASVQQQSSRRASRSGDEGDVSSDGEAPAREMKPSAQRKRGALTSPHHSLPPPPPSPYNEPMPSDQSISNISLLSHAGKLHELIEGPELPTSRPPLGTVHQRLHGLHAARQSRLDQKRCEQLSALTERSQAVSSPRSPASRMSTEIATPRSPASPSKVASTKSPASRRSSGGVSSGSARGAAAGIGQHLEKHNKEHEKQERSFYSFGCMGHASYSFACASRRIDSYEHEINRRSSCFPLTKAGLAYSQGDQRDSPDPGAYEVKSDFDPQPPAKPSRMPNDDGSSSSGRYGVRHYPFTTSMPRTVLPWQCHIAGGAADESEMAERRPGPANYSSAPGIAEYKAASLAHPASPSAWTKGKSGARLTNEKLALDRIGPSPAHYSPLL